LEPPQNPGRFNLLGLGGKELAFELVELLLQQVALGTHDTQFTDQRFTAQSGLSQRQLQGGELLGSRHVNHCLLRSKQHSEVP
jgi:hypothetical protein